MGDDPRKNLQKNFVYKGKERGKCAPNHTTYYNRLAKILEVIACTCSYTHAVKYFHHT